MSGSQSTYSNFNDPFGLACRMLRRATRESIGPLLQMGFELAAKPANRLAARWESFEERDDEVPQILVVGLPRTGTTMVSQLLAQYLDASYFPNMSAMFPSAPIWASKRVAGDFSKAPQTLKNFFGSTAGLRGISDGFHIWNRWFGSNRYCVDRTPSEEEVAELQAFFGIWSGVFQKPLLNKNNRNVDAIARLAKYLPNAYFVVVERDPAMTVQSLLNARHFVQGSDSVGWGLFANRFDSESDPIVSVCKQVAYGTTRLEEQLAQVLPERFARFRYTEFCESPSTALESVLELVEGLKARPRISFKEMPSLRANSSVSVCARDWSKIKDTLSLVLSSENAKKMSSDAVS